MKYKAVIFDLDGVICHTDMYHYQAWKQIADELGIYFDEEINNRLRGVSRMESFEIILERYDGQMIYDQKKRSLQRTLKKYEPGRSVAGGKRNPGWFKSKGLKAGNRLIQQECRLYPGTAWTGRLF